MAAGRQTVGIIGAGQLARMLIEAATPLDVDIRLLAAGPADCAARMWPIVVFGAPDDPDQVAAFARACDVVTFDHELVPEPVLQRLEAIGVALAPLADTMRIAQNKQRQREGFAQAGLPQPDFRIADSLNSVKEAAKSFGYPLIVKAARGGYDGRGVWSIADEAELVEVATRLLDRGTTLIAEPSLSLDRELAIMVARDRRGHTALYPVVETVQIDGICRQVNVSAHYRSRYAAAEEIAKAIANQIDLVGVLAVELFEVDGQLLINEIATRPHNSGHYSIEAVETSQFEQHLRAIMGLPLGSTKLRAKAAVMVNVLGGTNGADPRSHLDQALAMTGVHVHLYGKEARPGRKLGHVTTLGPRVERCADRAWRAVELLTNEPRPEATR
jgi:5-(carboxyamino)imidazole ribonucleotide synthase